jgi:dethiobiotin synthetase
MPKAQKFFIAGIGTEVGKTVVSSIFVQALGADYWKPVQTGAVEGRDTETVRQLAADAGQIFPESYLFQKPISPHAAAAEEKKTISLHNCVMPFTVNHLVVEGAGGVMSPLGKGLLVMDLITHLQLPVILVARHYLGSINHTLLTVEALERRNIEVRGIVFNGVVPLEEYSEDFISEFTHIPALLYLPPERIDQAFVKKHAAMLRSKLL